MANRPVKPVPSNQDSTKPNEKTNQSQQERGQSKHERSQSQDVGDQSKQERSPSQDDRGQSQQERGNWGEQKTKLKEKFPTLTDADLRYENGKKDEMLRNVQSKLGKTKEEFDRILAQL